MSPTKDFLAGIACTREACLRKYFSRRSLAAVSKKTCKVCSDTRSFEQMNESGVLELEGSLDELVLPTNLMSSIRMRLAAVQSTKLELLLNLAAVLGGLFSTCTIVPVWRALCAGEGDGGASVAAVPNSLLDTLHKAQRLRSGFAVLYAECISGGANLLPVGPERP